MEAEPVPVVPALQCYGKDLSKYWWKWPPDFIPNWCRHGSLILAIFYGFSIQILNGVMINARSDFVEIVNGTTSRGNENVDIWPRIRFNHRHASLHPPWFHRDHYCIQHATMSTALTPQKKILKFLPYKMQGRICIHMVLYVPSGCTHESYISHSTNLIRYVHMQFHVTCNETLPCLDPRKCLHSFLITTEQDIRGDRDSFPSTWSFLWCPIDSALIDPDDEEWCKNSIPRDWCYHWPCEGRAHLYDPRNSRALLMEEVEARNFEAAQSQGFFSFFFYLNLCLCFLFVCLLFLFFVLSLPDYVSLNNIDLRVSTARLETNLGDELWDKYDT